MERGEAAGAVEGARREGEVAARSQGGRRGPTDGERRKTQRRTARWHPPLTERRSQSAPRYQMWNVVALSPSVTSYYVSRKVYRFMGDGGELPLYSGDEPSMDVSSQFDAGHGHATPRPAPERTRHWRHQARQDWPLWASQQLVKSHKVGGSVTPGAECRAATRCKGPFART